MKRRGPAIITVVVVIAAAAVAVAAGVLAGRKGNSSKIDMETAENYLYQYMEESALRGGDVNVLEYGISVYALYPLERSPWLYNGEEIYEFEWRGSPAHPDMADRLLGIYGIGSESGAIYEAKADGISYRIVGNVQKYRHMEYEEQYLYRFLDEGFGENGAVGRENITIYAASQSPANYNGEEIYVYELRYNGRFSAEETFGIYAIGNDSGIIYQMNEPKYPGDVSYTKVGNVADYQ